MKVTNIGAEDKTQYGEAHSIVIDETLLVPGTQVEGLVLIQEIENDNYRSGAPVVRVKARLKHGGLYSVNIPMNPNQDILSDDSLQNFLNKIVYITAMVNQFRGATFLEVLTNPGIYEGDLIKPTDFYPTVQDLISHKEMFNNHLSSMADNQLVQPCVNAIRNVGLSKILGGGLLDLPISHRGDSLLLLNNILNSLDSFEAELPKDTIDIAKLVAIVYVGIDTLLNNLNNKKHPLLPKGPFSQFGSFKATITKYNLLDNEKCMEEITHLFGVLKCGEEPLTFTSKFVSTQYRSFLQCISATRMEQSTKAGMRRKFVGATHISI